MNVLHAQFHILASVSGYQTVLKSSGLAEEDRKKLESLGFGQTDQESFLSSLEKNPAAIGRPLPSGGYAVTRCLRGEPDTAGRTTLKFISIIFNENDWIQTASKCLPDLLHNLDIWNEVCSDPHTLNVRLKQYAISPNLKPTALAVLDTLINSDEKSVLVMTDSELNSESLMLLPSLLPPKERSAIAWGIRVLSTGMNVRICTLPTMGDRGGRRKTIYVQQGATLSSPYAMALNHFWDNPSLPPFEFIDKRASTQQLFSHTTYTQDHPEHSKSGFTLSKRFYAMLGLVIICIGLGFAGFNLLTSSPNSQVAQEVVQDDEALIQSPPSLAEENPETKKTSPPIPTFDSQTPNEQAAIHLVERFSESANWNAIQIGKWRSEARSLLHVDKVVGFNESVKRAKDVLDWQKEAIDKTESIKKKWNSRRFINTSFISGKKPDIGNQEDVEIDLETVRNLQQDQRQNGFSGINKPAFNELIALLTTWVHVLESNKVPAMSSTGSEEDGVINNEDHGDDGDLREEEISIPVQVQQSPEQNQRFKDQQLQGVIDETKDFMKLRKTKPEPYAQAPSIEKLRKWWEVLDYEAVLKPSGNLVSQRRQGRKNALLAIRWRFHALVNELAVAKGQLDETNNKQVKNESWRDIKVIRDKVSELREIHVGINPQEDQDDLLIKEMNLLIKEMDKVLWPPEGG